ncbi:MAG TPA: protein-L-isoaspartate(D-aspartate) O-methyltransferase [Candidatus Saccharimonadales bacterium]|nr:protein-L-isoaspartate(D-aspartate) O-methyltransferase [Candidatus Saccharimonadales bacterium]
MAGFNPFGWRRTHIGGPDIPEPFEHQRREMVGTQLRARGIRDERVLEAMGKVPRHEFLPTPMRYAAYQDRALPIGEGETISQPYIVALTCQALQLEPGQHVLDVGSGTGYQTAVLVEMGCVVWGVEIDPELAAASRARLERLGYRGFEVRSGDGTLGWAEHAPFDAVAVAAAAPEVPPALLRQMRDGGRLVAPLGDYDDQMLVRVVRHGADYERANLTPVRFVPLRFPG